MEARARHRTRSSSAGLTVADVMTREVAAVNPQATCAEIVDAMRLHRVDALPVISVDGQLLGVVSEADLLAKQAYPPRIGRAGGRSPRWPGRMARWRAKSAGRVAAELMTRRVDTVEAGADLGSVARFMLARGRTRLPVLAAGRVVGMVARRDLLAPFFRADEDLADEIRVLIGQGDLPEGHDVQVEVENGVVRLYGSTRVPGDIPAVTALATRVPGVVGVDSHLFAREPNPGGRF
jgi:CBS domain-containing protein